MILVLLEISLRTQQCFKIIHHYIYFILFILIISILGVFWYRVKSDSVRKSTTHISSNQSWKDSQYDIYFVKMESLCCFFIWNLNSRMLESLLDLKNVVLTLQSYCLVVSIFWYLLFLILSYFVLVCNNTRIFFRLKLSLINSKR